jgi:hypothetical protein
MNKMFSSNSPVSVNSASSRDILQMLDFKDRNRKNYLNNQNNRKYQHPLPNPNAKNPSKFIQDKENQKSYLQYDTQQRRRKVFQKNPNWQSYKRNLVENKNDFFKKFQNENSVQDDSFFLNKVIFK